MLCQADCFHQKTEQTSIAGKASAKQRANKRSTSVEHPLKPRATVVQLTSNQQPVTNNQEKKQGAKNAPLLTFSEFLENVKANGEKAISDYSHVWEYAERVGIPKEWVGLAWRRFSRKYQADKKKKYIDWRHAFSNAVEDSWFGFWYFDAAGVCTMSSKGFAEQKLTAAEAA